MVEGPFAIAVLISVKVQSLPQSTGQPYVAYCNKSCAAGCSRAPYRGLIRPTKGLSIMSFVVIVLYLRWGSDSFIGGVKF